MGAVKLMVRGNRFALSVVRECRYERSKDALVNRHAAKGQRGRMAAARETWIAMPILCA